jgi:hypothetical protein
VKLKPWTDSNGRKIDDGRVLRGFGDTNSTKAREGPWRLLRMAHYRPRGEINFSEIGRACRVEFRLEFETSGAAALLIIPLMDGEWSYPSNGRMEKSKKR